MVEFLGYIVLDDGIFMDEKNKQTIVDWIAFSSVKDVQCFLGFTNFYRIFINDYSTIATLLIHLTRKNKFLWNEKVEEAFEALKKVFTSARSLCMQIFQNHFS
jgi:hypothetical protein